MTKLHRRIVLAAVMAGVLIQGVATAAEPLRVTEPVHATEGDENPGRLYSAPYLAVDPGNPLNVVAAVSELRARRCGLLRSTDGGQTWRMLDSAPSPPSYPFCTTPVFGGFQNRVAFGRDGTLYYLLTGWDTRDGGTRAGNISVLLARSDDLGDSWETTIVHDTRGKTGDDIEQDRPVSGLAVDTRSGKDDIVYVGWARRLPARLSATSNAEPIQPFAAVSTDGGRTFSTPVSLVQNVFESEALRSEAIRSTTTTVATGSTTTTTAPPAGSRAAQPNQAANFGGFNPWMTVDREGTVYAVWAMHVANVTPAPPRAHFLSRSTDRGRTWSTTRIGEFTYESGSIMDLAWSPKGGEEGSLHLVYGGNPLPHQASFGDVYHRRSTDGGRTWTEPRILTDDDLSQQVGQYHPILGVAPNGRVDVAWWDTRDDPGIRGNDVYYTSSTDGGATWSENIRITDRTVDRKVGVWAYNFDMSSPPGMASADALTVFGWDDTRNTDPSFADNTATGGGVQDIYTAAAQHAAIGTGTSKAVKFALAGVIGLLVVGLVLVVMAYGTRRGTGAPKAERASERTPAGVS